MSEPTHHNPLQRAVLKAIRWYQRYWSPDHSSRKQFYPYGYCRYTPTCSEYGHDAVAKYGVLRGSLMAFWRILRCNRWSRGGYDPVK